jgi:hypothetical protein
MVNHNKAKKKIDTSVNAELAFAKFSEKSPYSTVSLISLDWCSTVWKDGACLSADATRRTNVPSLFFFTLADAVRT